MRHDFKSRINERLGDLLARYVRFVGAHARAILWTSLAVTLVAGAYTVIHLEVNTDEDALFAEESP